MNHLVFIKRQLYILKRQYGTALDIYTSDYNVDLSTGAKTVNMLKMAIKRAIILPISFINQGIYNQTFMKNIGREFAYGNILGQEIKNIILDQKDLPKDYNITPENSYIILDNNRYEILKVQKLEKNLGYELFIKRLTGVPLAQIHILNVTQSLRIIQRQVWI